MNVVEIAPGLWGWAAPHPEWSPRYAWDERVWSWYVELEDATVVVDPLVPRDDAERFWRHLDADVERRGLPVAILLTASHHRRSSDDVGARYAARVWEGTGELPRGVRTFPIEHPTPVERPLWFEDHRALAFGDAVKAADGELRVWWDERWREGRAWYDEHLLPSLRPLLELPVAHVLVGHGGPVIGNGAAELRAAVERPPTPK